MNVNKIRQTERLTGNGIALVVTQLFRLLFGGFLIGKDLYDFLDPESALTVLVIYVLIGILTTLFLLGKRYGVTGLIVLSVVLIIMQSIYIIAFFSQTTIDPSWHDPVANWWATVLNFLFPLLTLVFAIKVYRET
ncbi:MAG: hypothetical protein GQ580_06910 [Candidatus Thorarchaeota archaeon]|nr:hypothetical protein [Candidatus Thorarchaeota archaeon]